MRDADPIRHRLEALFENQVGDALSAEEEAEARKEAERRIKEKIPPGYMDRDKDDPCGDYLIWHELIQEAAKRKVPTLFVTEDRKEDWFRRERGLTLGPRIELSREMASKAEVAFFLMTTETFLREVNAHEVFSVSSETVEQAAELPDALDVEERSVLEGRVMREIELLRAERANLQMRLDQASRAAMEAEREVELLQADLAARSGTPHIRGLLARMQKDRAAAESAREQLFGNEAKVGRLLTYYEAAQEARNDKHRSAGNLKDP